MASGFDIFIRNPYWGKVYENTPSDRLKKKSMASGFDVFMRNPYWRQLYENAPSDRLKEWYKRSFEYDGLAYLDLSVDEKAKIRKELDKQDRDDPIILTREDWQYLFDNTTNQMERAFIRKIMSRLDKKMSSDERPV